MYIDYNFEISLMDHIKCEVGVLVPVLKALRTELGEERANRLVLDALRERLREFFHRLAERFPGSPKDKYDALNALSLPRIGNDVDFQWLKDEPDAKEFNVTGCRYADYLRQIGEPELGNVLLCYADFCIAEVGWPEVELTRTQTIMEGADYCDFRYRIKSGQVPK